MRSLKLVAPLAVAVAFVVPVASGQGSAPERTPDPGITSGAKQRALTSARRAWNSQRVPSYAFTLSVNCFCPPTTGVRIVVRKGVPSPATPRDLRDQATVPRLFRTIQHAIDRKVARLVVSYGKRGVPRSIFIDTDERIADEEIGYLIRGFTPLKR